MALIIYAPLFLYMHKSKVSHDTVHMSFRLYQGRKNRRRAGSNIYNMFCPSYIALRVRRS